MRANRNGKRTLWQRATDAWSALFGTGYSQAYSGAQSNRLTQDWIHGVLSADAAIQNHLGKMRERARDLVRNNAAGAQVNRLWPTNIVGPHGVRLQCRVKNNRKNFDEKTNAAVEFGFKDWGRPEYCSWDGRLSWIDIQRRVIQLVKTEGEAIVRLWEHGEPPYGFSLELLDPDLLDAEYHRTAADGVNEIRFSIELDRRNRPVAYHFLKSHPNDIARRPSTSPAARTTVPAGQILHLYQAPRIGQTRGMTEFAPVLLNLRMLGAYQEAEVIAARVAASKLGVIQYAPEAFNLPADENAVGPEEMAAEPGSFMSLLPGQTIEAFDPQHPTDQYRDFVKGQSQSVAAGLGVSYQSLSADLEGTSFSSGRTGLLQERDEYRAQQVWLIEHLHIPIFERWLKWASVMDIGVERAKVDTIKRSVVWQPRGWDWVDPKNDVQAKVLEIEKGLTSRTRSLAEKGEDFEEVADELAEEQKLADSKGIDLSAVTPAPAAEPDKDEPPPDS